MPHPTLRWFKFDHLPRDRGQLISSRISALAHDMEVALGEGPEKSAGMRKLLEAKDCFVRQSIVDQEIGVRSNG